MDVILYIVIGLGVLVALFLFARKGQQEQRQNASDTPEIAGKQPARGAVAPARKKESAPQADRAPSQGVPDPSTAKAPPPPSGSRARLEPSPGPPETKSKEPRPPERDISGLRTGLAKSRGDEGFFGRIRSLFASKPEINPELAEQLEEVLLSSDVGVSTTQSILDRIRTQLSSGDLKSETQVWQALRTEAHRILDVDGASGSLRLEHKPTVVLFVGVNGAGKTTTIGKLATKLQAQGKTCVLAAGDTFRAAAVQQLVVWGQRVGCEVVRGKDGADPGSVIFDAVKKAQEHNADVVLADTAGRLHTKSNLMAQMQKIARTTGKALDGAPHEILLVIDATNGQNAMAQAKEFKETLDLTGIVLTKLDGTAKGGVLLGISDSLKLPVRFIGLGERPDDLHEFVANDFIEALLGKET
jgi:fused signal recognition particle receptor